jgi:uncharacterized membrane protein YjjB (DUF3815 family)
LIDEPCHVAVSYRGIAIFQGQDGPAWESVTELRYNTAVQAQVHEILQQVRLGALKPHEALLRLERIEADTPRHAAWLTALVLGAAAASLAALLGSDAGAAAVAGVATAIGLFARRELGRRHFSPLALPLAAAFIGAALGGIAIRLGWTDSPELALVVPALMLVPGPHLINGLLDLIDNHLPMSLARLGLATGILLASAAGIVLGGEIVLLDPIPDAVMGGDRSAHPDRLNLFSDVVLAGIATCGFAVFYNTPWRQMWMAVAGGMTGHGLRFLALQAGLRLEAATFLGSLAVGIVSAWIAHSRKMPVAVIAFAGAVTMMPGLHMYRALGGALRLARQSDITNPGSVEQTLANAFETCLVVSALALGLVVGARMMLGLTGERGLVTAVHVPHAGSNSNTSENAK